MSNEVENTGKILIYQNEKGDTRIDVYFESDTIWMTQKANLLQETVAVSPLYGVFTPLTFGLGYFLHTYFQSAICARNYLLPIVQKGAKNTINITNDTFISSKLYLPLDVEEQKAIHSLRWRWRTVWM